MISWETSLVKAEVEGNKKTKRSIDTKKRYNKEKERVSMEHSDSISIVVIVVDSQIGIYSNNSFIAS